MFAVRGALVSLGFFGVLYCILSLVTVCIWRCWSRFARESGSSSARLLFALRTFPLAGAALITLVFALPAFLLLESNSIDEDYGTLIFGVCSVLMFAVGLFRVLSARSRTSLVVAEWMDGAKALNAGAAAPTLQTRSGVPPLVLVGVARQTVLVSETAVSLLSDDELRVAVRHEIAHMRSRDNLKKMVLQSAPFPGMGSLEDAWEKAAELAADSLAVSTRREALDLAAALVKVSELAPLQDPPPFTTGLVNASTLVKLRVQRLLAWNETHRRNLQARLYYVPLVLIPLVLALAVYIGANYGRALSLTHQITEWFIH